ncbi:hypothetical protein [Streptomyces sp. NPDC059224]|uniref:hypothetical protein n=1 Tax=Streptomyces sp. NPDC059224 TaxID=3346775 RepID=UPI0036BD578A
MSESVTSRTAFAVGPAIPGSIPPRAGFAGAAGRRPLTAATAATGLRPGRVAQL